MPKVKILDAVPDNAWGIVNVLYKTWLATYPNKEFGITTNDIEESYKESFTKENLKKLSDKITQLNQNERRLVAKIGNNIVGVATIVRNENNNLLKTIYVLPEFQGKGIGKMLWQEAKRFCDQNKDIILQVATYNKNTIEFYKKLGFIDTGKRFIDTTWRVKRWGVSIPEMEMVIKAKF